jgi:hypothetical protein
LHSHLASPLDIYGDADDDEAVAELNTPPNAVYSPAPYSPVQSPPAVETPYDGSEDEEVGWQVQPGASSALVVAEARSPVLEAAGPASEEAPSYVLRR